MSDEANTSMVEFEIENKFDVDTLRKEADRLRDTADHIESVADNMEKGRNVRAKRIVDEEDE